MAARCLPVILVGESDLSNRLNLQQAFEAASAPVDLRFVDSGEEFLAYLNRQTPWQNADSPRLILLDVASASADGRLVLQEIKKTPHSRMIPVVALTNPGKPEDVTQAYNLGANACIQRPSSPHELDRIVKTICEYWFRTCMLPET